MPKPSKLNKDVEEILAAIDKRFGANAQLKAEAMFSSSGAGTPMDEKTRKVVQGMQLSTGDKRLTKPEKHLVTLINEGLGNKEIGKALGQDQVALHQQMLGILIKTHDNSSLDSGGILDVFMEKFGAPQPAALQPQKSSSTPKNLQGAPKHAIKKEQYEKRKKAKAVAEQTNSAVLDAPPRPGEVIRSELIDGQGLGVGEIAKKLGIARVHLSYILNGTRNLTPDVAVRLSDEYGLYTDEEWLAFQDKYDIWKVRQKKQFPSLDPL